MPVAVNCWVAPAAIVGNAGVTAMDMSTFTGVTVRRVCPVIPDSIAETTEVPVATPVANPEALIVAAAVVAEAHVTWAVMSCVVFGPEGCE